jgi:hypothetical protein
MVGLPVLSVLAMGSSYTPYTRIQASRANFKFVWGLHAGTEVLHRSRFPCLTRIAGQIIYDLTMGVPGV